MSKRQLSNDMREVIGLLGLQLPSAVISDLSDRLTEMALAWAEAQPSERDRVLVEHEGNIRQHYALGVSATDDDNAISVDA